MRGILQTALLVVAAAVVATALLVPEPLHAQLAAEIASVGAKVEVVWQGRWYPATVTAVRQGEVRIRYDGWGDSWDEWVGPDRVRRSAAPAAISTAPAPPAPSTSPSAPRPVERTPAPAALPANPPMGEYAVYQWNGPGGFAYQYRVTLAGGGRYRVRDNEWGTYSYSSRTKRLSFTAGPLRGFGGLYYTRGRNASGPTIALNPAGAVTDLEGRENGAYQYAFFRPSGVR